MNFRNNSRTDNRISGLPPCPREPAVQPSCVAVAFYLRGQIHGLASLPPEDIPTPRTRVSQGGPQALSRHRIVSPLGNPHDPPAGASLELSIGCSQGALGTPLQPRLASSQVPLGPGSPCSGFWMPISGLCALCRIRRFSLGPAIQAAPPPGSQGPKHKAKFAQGNSQGCLPRSPATL